MTTTMTTTMNIRIRKPRSCRCTTISQSSNLQFLFVIKLYLFTHFNWPITNSSSCWNLEFHECNTERQLIRKLTPERYSRYFTSSLRYLRYDWSFFLSVSADRFLFALMQTVLRGKYSSSFLSFRCSLTYSQLCDDLFFLAD